MKIKYLKSQARGDLIIYAGVITEKEGEREDFGYLNFHDISSASFSFFLIEEPLLALITKTNF